MRDFVTFLKKTTLGAAFGAADHDVDGAIVQGVERCQIAFARHAGDALHALRDELVDEDLAPVAGVAVRCGHESSLQVLAMRRTASLSSCSEAA